MRTAHGNGFDEHFHIVLSVTFAAFIVAVDNYIVNIALPTITAAFGIDTGEASWIALSYILAVVSTMLLFGKVADRIGSKKVFIAGYGVFGLGSLLCGLSPNLGFLVASRALQGLGGSMLYVSSFEIISEHVPEDKRGRAFGMASAAVGLGLITGAPLGGFITQYLSWHWVFGVNVPVCVGAILFGLRVIPSTAQREKPDSRQDSRFDVTGGLLCLTGLLALVFGLNRADSAGWRSPLVLASLCAAALALATFLLNERKQPDPVLNFAIFRSPTFIAGNIDAFAAFGLFSGSNFLLPFYLERVKGLTSSQAGLAMMTYSVVYLALSPFGGRLSDAFSPRLLSSVALLSGAASVLTFAMTLHLDGLLPSILYLLWLAVSMAFFFPINNNMVMRAVPAEHLGSGTGTYRTLCHLGVLMGVCLYEAVFSHGIPEGVAGVSGSPGAAASPELLMGAFRNAFLFGGVLGIAALLVQMFLKKE